MQVSRDHYYRLASEVPDERISAAAALLKDLAAANSDQDWDYAVERLIKGLSTTRQSARFGFSMALTELISDLIPRQAYDLSVASYLAKVVESNQTRSNMKGKEERASLFGKLFGLQSLLNSHLLESSTLASETDLKTFVDCLFDLAMAKSWLRETSVFTLCQFISQCDLDSSIVVYILQRSNDLGLNLSTEGIAIYLSIPVSTRQAALSKVTDLKSSWKNGDPLSRGNLPTLARALKDVEAANSPDEKIEFKQKGSWNPRVHFVWDILLSKLLQPEPVQTPSKKRKTNNKTASEDKFSIKEFWQVVIDETMFAEKASHERKYWGFEILQKALVLADEADISSLLSKNLLRCLINQSSQANRMLNKISVKVLNTIKQEAIKNPTKAPLLLSCLSDSDVGGCWNFDLITKSRTTESLVAVLGQCKDLSDEKTAHVLGGLKSVLISQFNKAFKTDEIANENAMKKPNDNIEKWCLNMLLNLIKSNRPALENPNISDKWLQDILRLIIKHSFFQKVSGSSVSINVRSLCQERLTSVLSQIVNCKRESGSWPLFCVQLIRELESSKDSKLIQELDEELLVVKKECLVMLETIDAFKKSKKAHDKVYCFELLFSMVLLQIYMGDEDAFAVVDELKVCFESAFSDEESEVDSSVVLTEIILSFISKKSGLLRKFSLIIWESLLCQTNENDELPVTEKCLSLLYDVLEARENKEGQQQLFEGDDEMVDVSGDEKEDAKESSSSESESDSESEDEKDDDDPSNVDKETNLKLAAALGIPTESSGEVKFEDLSSEDEDDSQYESESMDDEQMMAMDDQLSKIFKERRDILANTETGNKRKNDVAEAREQMIFFKHRILDLLEIFARVQPKSYLNFTMIKPILILIDLTLDKNVAAKAQKLLKSRISKIKLEKAETPEIEQTLLQLLQWLHDQLRSPKNHKQAHQQACSQASVVVSKNLVTMDAKYIDQVIDTYSETLKLWAKNPKLKFQHTFFLDLINWLHSRRTM